MKFKVVINAYPFQNGVRVQDAPPIPNSTRKSTLDTDVGVGRSVFLDCLSSRNGQKTEEEVTVEEFRDALNQLLMKMEGKTPKERYPQVTTIEKVA